MRYDLRFIAVVLAGITASVSTIVVTRGQMLALAGMLIAVLAIHSRSLGVPPPPAPHIAVAEAMEQEVQPGLSLRQWLRSRITRAEALVSVNGQAVHYVLELPVISVIEPQFSVRPSDDAGFHSLMAHHGSRYLVVFPGWEPALVPEQEAIPFLRDLASGRNPPGWLIRVAQTSKTTVFDCLSCAQKPY